MASIYTSTDLRIEILALEAERLRQEEDLKDAAAAAIDSLKPVNLIKNAFGSTVKTPGLGKNLLKGAVGLAAGFLSKKILIGASSNVLKKALGTIVELGVAKAVASRAGKLTSSGVKMIGKAVAK
jgi:hypothetical protein